MARSCPKHGWIDTGAGTDATCPVCHVEAAGPKPRVVMLREGEDPMRSPCPSTEFRARAEAALERNRRYFNPARWELEQLMGIILRYQAAARNLLLARFRDGECDVVALLNFESEINEISEDLQKTEISL